MYLRILKKDFKNKRVINTILLLFIILATTFISSSVNNVVTTVTVLDDYHERAGMADYFLVTRAVSGEEKNAADVLNELDCIEAYTTEPILYMAEDAFKLNGGSIEISSAVVCPFEKSAITYFDDDNNPIKTLSQGKICIPQKILRDNDISIGDIVTVTVGNTSVELEVEAFVKDAMLGSVFMGLTRMLISEQDYNRLAADEASTMLGGSICSIFSKEVSAIEQKILDSDVNIAFMADVNLVKTCYILDMIIAGLLLVVSVCLLLISFVVLRFTINFTLTGEFREIGVMKAIGIKSRKTKGIYLVKYLMLSLAGALIGFFVSIPFGNMLLDNVSKNMVIESKYSYFLNLVCALAVVLIVMIFCYSCMGRIDKFSPIDAVRSGSTGERYKTKSLISLAKSRLHPISYLAFNDIVSDMKRYAIMLITFTLSSLIVVMLINTVNTLRSDKLVDWFCMTRSDFYVSNESDAMDYLVEGGRENAKKRISDVEKLLRKNGIPAKCFIEIAFKQTIEKDGNAYKALLVQGTGTEADRYAYVDGTPPQSKNEIAITDFVSEKLDATIGDTVTITDMGESKEYIITAIFQSMSNMGDGVRLHEDAENNYAQGIGTMALQIDFNDSPDKEELQRRRKKLEELLPDCQVMTGGEYVDHLIGVADTVEGVRAVLVPIMLLICVLVAVLMECSFIAKEKGEIAMLKAIGFNNMTVVQWHTMRMGLVLLIAAVLAGLLSVPATQLFIGPVFEQMGADYIEFDIKPLEAFVIYPFMQLSVSLFSVFLASLGTRKITASETANIE